MIARHSASQTKPSQVEGLGQCDIQLRKVCVVSQRMVVLISALVDVQPALSPSLI